MVWLLTGLICVVLVEITLRLPFAPAGLVLAATGRKAMRIVRSPAISDHWKEKAMGAYARRTFLATLRLGALICALLAPAVVLVLALDRLRPGFERFLLGWPGILASLLAATLYALARRELALSRNSQYGFLDRVLHRLALGLTPVAEMTFDIDQRRAGAAPAALDRRRHVFVSGLARAGTTVLMRRLHASGAFGSLTYRDMPFVLGPGLWSGLGQGAASSGPAERAHGDRLMVDVDSPESLDEAFWRLFDGKAYIRPDALVPHRPDDALLDRFLGYVHAILASRPGGADRYLSKNNNNILRLAALRRRFPNALILVPFRAPGEHAASLMRQHANFCTQQSADPFVGAYMGWLAHHEFGRDHRPFRFGEGAGATHPDPTGLDHWLALWCDTYDWLLASAPADAVFVCYEDLCTDPGVWQRIADLADIDGSGPQPGLDFTAPAHRALPASADPALLSRAQALYDTLRKRASAVSARTSVQRA